MTTDTNMPRRPDGEDRDLRLAVILLALSLGLMATGAVVYLTCEHPALAQPLGVGAAVASTITTVAGLVSRVLRR